MTKDAPEEQVRVHIEYAQGVYIANSKDLPGLSLCSRNKASLFKLIPEVIQMLYKENKGLEVDVRKMADVHDISVQRQRKASKPTNRFVVRHDHQAVAASR